MFAGIAIGFLVAILGSWLGFRDGGYDDAWYDVETATKASATLQSEITNRYNSWNILLATKAREKSNDT